MKELEKQALVSKRLNALRKQRKVASTKKAVLGICSIVGFFVLWQLLVTLGVINTRYIASPLEVIQGVIGKVTDPRPDGATLGTHILSSFQVAFSGFFLSIIIGAPLGLLMGWYKPVDKFFRPLFEVIRPIPPISWIPISILFLGIGVEAKAFIIFFSGFVPTLINSYTGVQLTNQTLINVGKTCGASNRKIFFTIGIPSAMPMVFAGFKLSLGNAWSTLVAAEMLAANSGLGYMIQMGRNFSRMDLIIGGMLIIGLLGILLSFIMELIESRVLKWRNVK